MNVEMVLALTADIRLTKFVRDTPSLLFPEKFYDIHFPQGTNGDACNTIEPTINKNNQAAKGPVRRQERERGYYEWRSE